MVSFCSEFRGPPVGEEQAFRVSQLVTQLSSHEFLLKPIKHHTSTQLLLNRCVQTSIVTIKPNVKMLLLKRVGVTNRLFKVYFNSSVSRDHK